jgi:hypothetical protein
VGSPLHNVTAVPHPFDVGRAAEDSRGAGKEAEALTAIRHMPSTFGRSFGSAEFEILIRRHIANDLPSSAIRHGLARYAL